MEKERWTKEESSASTDRAREAVIARCAVGKGMFRVLGALVPLSEKIGYGKGNEKHIQLAREFSFLRGHCFFRHCYMSFGVVMAVVRWW